MNLNLWYLSYKSKLGSPSPPSTAWEPAPDAVPIRPLGDSHVAVAIHRRGARASGTAEFPQWGWNRLWRSGAAGCVRTDGDQPPANPALDTATARTTSTSGGIRRETGHCEFKLRTWNPIRFSGLQLCMRIPLRPPLPGAHSGCADRYARFRLMTCPWGWNFGHARLPGCDPSGRLGDGQFRPHHHGVRLSCRSANCRRTASRLPRLVVARRDRTLS